MPERRAEVAFLSTVRSRLDLPDEIAHGVLDELTGHLRDTVDELAAQGLAAEEAEKQAIDRLGDARQLGDELSRVRHGRRQLLAGVGGGVWGMLVEGVRTYLVVALVGFVAAMFTLPIAGAILHAQGRSTSSLFGGTYGSLSTVLVEIAAATYLGRVLPARVARSAVRSVRSVRRSVAVVGLVLGSAALWFVPTFTPDAVLAIGVPLVPVAFAAAALGAPERPRFRPGARRAVVGVMAIVALMALVAVVSASESPMQSSWSGDTVAIGGVPTQTDADIAVDWAASVSGDPAVVDVRFTGTAVPPRFSAMHYELWPASLDNGIVTFGHSPLVIASADVTSNDTVISYRVPRPRDPVFTWAFIVGIQPDGQRTVLDTQFFEPTPPWRGTLFDWWSGRP